MRKMFGPKRAQATGDWRKLHNMELHYLCYSSSFINYVSEIVWPSEVPLAFLKYPSKTEVV
jgi:hypothetical protein